MSCNCEGITCPCGIPCSCPSSPCGCTDCKNSANHVNVCQLCWQQIDHSSKENTCRCFKVDSAEPESDVSQQRSAANSSTIHQLEINSGARVEGDSGAGVRTAPSTNVMTAPGFQMQISGIRVWQKFCANITTGAKAEVKEVSTDIVRKDSSVQVSGVDSGSQAKGVSGSSKTIRGNYSARVPTDSSAKVMEVSSNKSREDLSIQVPEDFGIQVPEVSVAQVRKDSRVQVSGVDSGSRAKGVSGRKVRGDYSARVPTDSSAKVMEVSSNKPREDFGIQVPAVSVAQVREDSSVQVSGVDSGSGAKGVSGRKVRGDYSARVPTDSSVKVMEVSGNKSREDFGIPGVSVAQVREDSSVQVRSAPHESFTSPSHATCFACGRNYLVSVLNFPHLCLECSGFVFVTPVFSYIRSSINPNGINYASNLIPNASVSIPDENLAQQIGGQRVELNQQFLEQWNQTSPEDKEGFINEWIKTTKIHPYRKDPI